MIAHNGPWTSEEQASMERDFESVHEPVLVSDVLAAIEPASDGWIVDATVGAGGHARAILERHPGVRLLGIDQDPEALAFAERTLEPYGRRRALRRARISQLAEACEEAGVDEIVGVLFDLGANSLHFDRPERGFSVQADGPLDMRMDPARERTAADIVNRWDEADLADLFYYEGGERQSRRIARAVVEARRRAPFLRTLALAELVERTLGGRRGRVHPATRVFQSLRRAVNEEGEELLRGLDLAESLLASNGALVVITFHSGEDGCVKRFFAEGVRAGRWSVESRKPLGPSAAERRANPRSRSARLRAGRRVRSQQPAADRVRRGRDEA